MNIDTSNYKILKYTADNWEYVAAWDNHEPQDLIIHSIELFQKVSLFIGGEILLDIDFEFENSFETRLGPGKYTSRIQKNNMTLH